MKKEVLKNWQITSFNVQSLFVNSPWAFSPNGRKALELRDDQATSNNGSINSWTERKGIVSYVVIMAVLHAVSPLISGQKMETKPGKCQTHN